MSIATDQVLVIAELSGNHNGDLGRARELIQAAKEAGADAVKLQTYTADTITLDADNTYFRITGGPWDGRRLYELYQEASTPWAWHEALFAAARQAGLVCFSSPFDPTAVAFLESLHCPIYKIASFELVDIPLLQCVARTGKPVIASTGMASLGEIATAVETLRDGGCPELALLSCVSSYPAKPGEMRLGTIRHLAEAFACPTGLSDHSPGHHLAVAAVACGARILEKHLTLRRADGGPDASFSMEPAEFAELVRAVRDVEQALAGGIRYGVLPGERHNVQFRKSLFFVRDLPAGHLLTAADVRVVRPGHGLPPAELPRVLGRCLVRAVGRAMPVLAGDLG